MNDDYRDFSERPTMRDWRPADNPRPRFERPRPQRSTSPFMDMLMEMMVGEMAKLPTPTRRPDNKEARIWTHMKDLLNSPQIPSEDVRESLGEGFDAWANDQLVARLDFLGLPLAPEYFQTVARREIKGFPELSLVYAHYSVPVSDDMADPLCEQVGRLKDERPDGLQQFSAFMIAQRTHIKTGETTLEIVLEMVEGGDAEQNRAATREQASINQTGYQIAELVAELE